MFNLKNVKNMLTTGVAMGRDTVNVGISAGKAVINVGYMGWALTKAFINGGRGAVNAVQSATRYQRTDAEIAMAHQQFNASSCNFQDAFKAVDEFYAAAKGCSRSLWEVSHYGQRALSPVVAPVYNALPSARSIHTSLQNHASRMLEDAPSAAISSIGKILPTIRVSA